MSDEQTVCTRCGAIILLLTARDRDGLCAPCSRGEREKVEEGKRRYREQKAYYESAAYKFWVALVRKPKAEMTEPEQAYFAATCLNGEVHNGGFEQYFTNSSGDDYSRAEKAMELIGPPEALVILREAKAALFGGADVPNWDERNRIARGQESNATVIEELEALDKRFWSIGAKVAAHIDAFGVANGFYPKLEQGGT